MAVERKYVKAKLVPRSFNIYRQLLYNGFLLQRLGAKGFVKGLWCLIL